MEFYRNIFKRKSFVELTLHDFMIDIFPYYNLDFIHARPNNMSFNLKFIDVLKSEHNYYHNTRSVIVIDYLSLELENNQKGTKFDLNAYNFKIDFLKFDDYDKEVILMFVNFIRKTL